MGPMLATHLPLPSRVHWSSPLLRHGLLLPGLLALLAWVAMRSGLDHTVAQWAYDAQAADFPARRWPALELWGHRLAKSAVLALWLLLVAAALASHRLPRLQPHRRLLWLTVAAMGLGPALVAGLKDINTHACPWDLKAFGGSADPSALWFVSRAEAGRCFPGGHAAGGFSLVALAFAGRALGRPRQAKLLLALALAVGLLFSVVRMSQGAHFLSHNLWSAAIDWSVAAWLLVPLWGRAPAQA